MNILLAKLEFERARRREAEAELAALRFRSKCRAWFRANPDLSVPPSDVRVSVVVHGLDERTRDEVVALFQHFADGLVIPLRVDAAARAKGVSR